MWRASQFGERYVQILVTENPHLLDIKWDETVEKRILSRIQFFHDYAQTRKNVWRLLVACPNVIVDNLAEIQEKLNFFTTVMRVEHTDVVKTSALARPMAFLKMRHEFLIRLGMYKPKSIKGTVDPTLPNANPSLYQIFDTNDKRFATKVALVSLEEYEVFQELYAAELRRQSNIYSENSAIDNDADDDDNDEDDDDHHQANQV